MLNPSPQPETLHLSEEQLLGLLEGEDCPAATAHMQLCERCSGEFTTLKAALSGFTLASNRLAADVPLIVKRSPVAIGAHRLPWLQGSLAFAAACAAFAVVLLHPAPQQGVPPTAVDAPAMATASAMDDAALLQSVNSDVDQIYAPSLQPLSDPSISTQ